MTLLGAAPAIALTWALWRFAARRGPGDAGATPLAVLILAACAGALALPAPALLCVCGALSAGAYDARTGYIPNRLVAATGVLCAVAALMTGGLAAASAGMLCAAGPLLILFAITRGRGIGMGDVKLAAAVGCGLGPAAMLGLAAAFIAGGIHGALLLAAGRATRATEIRFGPFLAWGAYAAALSGPR